jgi:uncharacterized protein
MPRKSPPPGFDRDELTPPPLGEGPWPVLALAPDVAGECNLACRYCAETATQPRRHPMSAKTLEAAWRFMFPDGQPREGFSIRLGSGEPLLALPLLRRLAKLVEASNGSAAEECPAVFLTTNGTLIDSEVRDWLASSGWHVKISIDGPKPIHDRWRVTPDGKGTFERIADTVAYLAQRMRERFSVTAVLCRDADPKEVFEAIADLGARRIELVPVAHKDKAVLPGPADVRRYESFVEDYARRYLENTGDSEIPTLIRLENCIARVMGYDVRRVSCGAGRSFFGIGPDGDLYPCFRFIGLEAYRLGRLSTGLDREAALAFQHGPGRPYEQRTPCRQCWAAPLCGGPCFACSEMFGPGEGRPVALHCAYTLADAATAVRLVNALRQRDPERLLSFLPDIVKVKLGLL